MEVNLLLASTAAYVFLVGVISVVWIKGVANSEKCDTQGWRSTENFWFGIGMLSCIFGLLVGTHIVANDAAVTKIQSWGIILLPIAYGAYRTVLKVFKTIKAKG